MNKVSKTVYVLFLVAMLVLPGISYAEIQNLNSAINKAGRQRMLTQRIVANYCQVGLEVQTEKSKKQLESAIELFDIQLSELEKYKPDGKLNKQIKKINTLWQPMKNVALSPVDKNQVEELRGMAEEVLRHSHKLVIMLQDESSSKSGRLVNISGRQRMLSQRMSSLYMLQSWGYNSSVYANDYLQAINEFKEALIELKSHPGNTSRIKKMLNTARKQFSLLEKSLQQKDGEFIPRMVKMSADKLLLIMDDVTHEYEKLESN